jgi:hypothetical protein
MPLCRRRGVSYSGPVSFALGDPVLSQGREAGGLRVGQEEQERMAAAAARIRACREELVRAGSTIVVEATGGAAPFSEWRHYPEGEVYDPESHAQFFYHAHPGTGRPAREHGHFHTFLRAEGAPPGVQPLLLPEIAVAHAPPPQAAPLKRGACDEVSHIVAISVDRAGAPIRLFTTNRWVTGETWYRAEDVIAMLDRFRLGDAAAPALLSRWVAAVVALFRPQIAALLCERDAAVMAWRRRRRAHVFEDVRLEVASSLDIDLDAQLAFVDALGSAGRGDRSARLPPMAEGWGG